jgi:large subunit ribosomal protein L40
MMFRGKLRQERVAKLQSLQDSIHRTLMELRATDERLYNIAVAGTRETEKRFPLVMRIPTHTLPLKRWNYAFNRTNIKGDGGVAKPG